MTINQDIKGVVPLRDSVAVYYFAWLIEGHQTELLTLWRKEGATVESLELDLVKSCLFPLPPFLEQVAIAAFLDRETERLDSLLSKVEQAVERLQEYRTALITAAVTGKIDVRVTSQP
jgi:restriction endonuclease S subunit